MSLSEDALKGVLASATNVVYLECLTITHSDFSDGPLRLVNDREDLTRTAGEFIAFPFQIQAPAQSADQAPGIHVTADMVDQRILHAVRSIAGVRERATFKYEVVTKGTPNTVEWGPIDFTLDEVSTDGLSTIGLRASLSMGVLNDAFPHMIFSPGNRGN